MKYKYLTVKDVLWCGLLKLDVPHQGNPIWFMRSILIIVIGGNQQLRILGVIKAQSGKGWGENTLTHLQTKYFLFNYVFT